MFKCAVVKKVAKLMSQITHDYAYNKTTWYVSDQTGLIILEYERNDILFMFGTYVLEDLQGSSSNNKSKFQENEDNIEESQSRTSWRSVRPCVLWS